jgi:signal transduction histidine kinase
MSFTHFVVIFFLIQYLRKFFQTPVQFPEWDRLLIKARLVAIGLLVVEVLFSVESLTKWFWHIFLLLFLAAIYRIKEFRSASAVLYTVLPYFIISVFGDLLQLISQSWYESWDNYIDSAIFFSFIFMFAMWFSTRKQQTALELERQKTREEEEHSRLIESRRAELEHLVAERTNELRLQKEELQHALTELKSTQTQLIHREKLASLGELTAGIAHEIQNPLNFVNNFSELSVELVEELKQEIIQKLPDTDKKYTDEILQDLSQNLEKIHHHGKRADSIVKNMLQHSRASQGEKQDTDINTLVNEYLHLSYHGFRANDKVFNAKLTTQLDTQAAKVNIVPQDIGRVLLNLFNNAFYATGQKKMQLNGQYQPEVQVWTKDVGNKIEIRIKDNGTGIPGSVKSKIFQPFFSTKPTGEGTGLGLSLSYEIITKGHGGNMQVETQEGEFTEFIIELPKK